MTFSSSTLSNILSINFVREFTTIHPFYVATSYNFMSHNKFKIITLNNSYIIGIQMWVVPTHTF